MKNKMTEIVINTTNLVSYQDGSIVSRELIKKDTGTVSVFAFDKGQGLSEHTAPFDAMVYILDGKANIKIGEEHFEVKIGETLIMPADKPHSVKAAEKFKMLLVMVK
ncbi:MAG: cupin domain-containing protein [Candidatus Omnitrophota bacterium]